MDDLPPTVRPAEDGGDDPTDARSDEELRRELVRQLAEARGNVTEVARAMGKARQQVQRWLRRFHLAPEAFRDKRP